VRKVPFESLVGSLCGLLSPVPGPVAAKAGRQVSVALPGLEVLVLCLPFGPARLHVLHNMIVQNGTIRQLLQRGRGNKPRLAGEQHV
jgi:hypothetical protein